MELINILSYSIKGTNITEGKSITVTDKLISEAWIKLDKANGRGRVVFDNGSIYEVEYVDNKRNGKGKTIFSDGDTYEGEWKDNNYHGIGVYKHSDGEVYIGQYVNGKREGLGKFISFIHIIQGFIYGQMVERQLVVIRMINYMDMI